MCRQILTGLRGMRKKFVIICSDLLHKGILTLGPAGLGHCLQINPKSPDPCSSGP